MLSYLIHRKRNTRLGECKILKATDHTRITLENRISSYGDFLELTKGVAKRACKSSWKHGSRSTMYKRGDKCKG